MSSTRCEAHGLLVSVMRPGPVHVGIDNQAVVSKGNKLKTIAQQLENQIEDKEAQARDSGLAIVVARKMWKPEKHTWAMQKDSDMWQCIWRALLAKSSRAVVITKVTGHLTDQDIEEGKGTIKHKKGNHEANALADNGTKSVGIDVADTLNWFGTKHRAYCKLMCRFQPFIVTMMIAVKETREDKKKAGNPFGEIIEIFVNIPRSLDYANDGRGRLLHVKPLPDMPHPFIDQQYHFNLVHTFISIMRMRPPCPEELGVIWIELLIAY